MKTMLLVLALGFVMACSDVTAPTAKPSFDSGNGCNGPSAKAACAGYNPSKHNP